MNITHMPHRKNRTVLLAGVFFDVCARTPVIFCMSVTLHTHTHTPQNTALLCVHICDTVRYISVKLPTDDVFDCVPVVCAGYVEFSLKFRFSTRTVPDKFGCSTENTEPR